MPIEGIEQPEVLYLSCDFRFIKAKPPYDFALVYYQDKATVEGIDGVGTSPYSLAKLNRMYTCLHEMGECYFIETMIEDHFVVIGDITLCLDDLPLTIFKGYQHCGYGSKAIELACIRARQLNLFELRVDEIYSENTASLGLVRKMGFEIEEKTEKGYRFYKDL